MAQANAEGVVLLQLVQSCVRDRAASLGLDRETVTVSQVLNWGGFVNSSFAITDRRRAYHLKLSGTAEGREALRRWLTLAPLLTPYHAPRIVDWVDLGPAAGLLFEFVAGAAPMLSREVIAELIPVLARLHADRELGAALQQPPITARAAYLRTFHERFTADLHAIRQTPPPFVDEHMLAWLAAEVDALARHVSLAPEFAEPLSSPVHGDLWLNNIVWLDRHTWHLIDWDDLHIGDPAADIATLLGPNSLDLTPLKLSSAVESQVTSTQRDRLPHLGRATLLDWVIDSLADWVEAPAGAPYEPVFRSEKERVHRLALDMYRRLFR